MPQKPNIIATKAVSAELLIFDSNKKFKNDTVKPELYLRGHKRRYAKTYR